MSHRNISALQTKKFYQKLKAASALTVPMLAFAGTMLMATGAMADYTPGVHELPQGHNVVSGSIAIGSTHIGSQNVMGVVQASKRGLIDWQSFNIGEQASVNFLQLQGSNSITVNRVVGPGNDPTKILGKMTANGKVMILDKNGVFFGANSKIDVGGIVASTGEIDATKFKNNGAIELSNFGGGAIVNEGNIVAKGTIGFVAKKVINKGTLKGQDITLAAGDVDVTIDFDGDRLVEFAVDKQTAETLIENTGNLIANNGTIALTAAAKEGIVNSVINMDGIATAKSVTVSGGVITLGGTVTANGGDINIESNGQNFDHKVTVKANTTLLANGGDINFNLGGTKRLTKPNTHGAHLTVNSGSRIEAVEVAGVGGNVVFDARNTDLSSNTRVEAKKVNIKGSNFSQNAGAIIKAEELTGNLVSAAAIHGVNNEIDRVTNFKTGILGEAGGLILGNGKDLILDGDIVTGALGAVTFNVKGDITQAGTGIISADKLQVTAQGDVDLTNDNMINTLNQSTIGGDFSLHDTNGYRIAGDLTAKGDINLTTNSSGQAQAIIVNAGRTITTQGGDFTVNTRGAANGGGFTLENGAGIDTRGVSGTGDVSITSRHVNLNANSFILGGAVYTDNRLLEQHASSRIVADSLSGKSLQTVLFLGTGNDIKSIGNFEVGLHGTTIGSFTLVNSKGLDITGAIISDGGLIKIDTLSDDNTLRVTSTGSLRNTGGDIVLNANQGFIRNDGVIDARKTGGNIGDVSLNARQIKLANGKVFGNHVSMVSNRVTQNSLGALSANKLTGTAKHSVSLMGNGNEIVELGNFTVGQFYSDVDVFEIRNNRHLNITGNVSTNGRDLNITSKGIRLEPSGALASNGGDISLAVAGDVNVNGGSLDANGGNVDVNQSGTFVADAGSVRTKGTGTINLQQNAGGSINNAVNAIANTGTGLNTVLVGDGTYNENVIIGQSNLQLLSRNGRGAATINGLVNAGANETILVTNSADNVTIGGAGKGFEITGLNKVINANGTTNLTIDGNTVTGLSAIELQDVVNADVTNNTINGITGIKIGGASSGVKIAKNNIIGIDTGIEANGVSNLSVDANDIRGMIAINLEDVTGVDITQNIVTGITGIAVGGTSTGVKVLNNNLANAGSMFFGIPFTYAIYNAAAAIVDARGNWFGTTDETNVSKKNKGNVDYSVYLAAGTDNPAIKGFQGDFSHLYVTTLGGSVEGKRIQSGIDMLQNGSLVDSSRIVDVLAGTYNESDVNIHKAMHLRGVAGGSIMDGLNKTKGGLFIDADDVTVTGMTLRNYKNGIELDRANNYVISGNNITDSYSGILATNLNAKNAQHATYGTIDGNTLSNITQRAAIETRHGQYADITNNVIRNSDVGIVVEEFQVYRPNGLTTIVDGNDIEARMIGIRANLSSWSAKDHTGFVFSNNNIRAIDDTVARRWGGIEVLAHHAGPASEYLNNNIDGSALVNRSSAGYEVTLSTNSNRPVIDGGEISHVGAGVWVTDRGQFSNKAHSGAVSDVLVTNVAFDNISEAAFYVEDTIENLGSAKVTIGAGNVFGNNVAYDLALAGFGAQVALEGGFAGVSKTLIKAADDSRYKDLASASVQEMFTTDSASIQTGVNATVAGGQVDIEAGTFLGNVVVDKAMNITGAGATDTLVSGSGAGTGFELAASDIALTGVGVQGFELGVKLLGDISNVAVTQNRINAGNGILVEGNLNGSNISIEDNIITSSTGGNGFAVMLDGVAADTVVAGNIIDANANGVWVNGSENAVVENNTIEASVGVRVSQGRDVIVNDNVMNDNVTGVLVFNANNVSVTENTIDNAITGIVIDDLSDDIEVARNRISNSMIGFETRNHFVGNVTLWNNTFNNNVTGASLSGGLIDMGTQGQENHFNGGDIGIVMSPSGPSNTLRLVNDSLGFTHFTGQNNFYVRLENGAYFQNAQPKQIDAIDVTFDGVSAGKSDFGRGILTVDQLNAIEAMLWDYDDENGIGQIFAGYVPGLEEEMFADEDDVGNLSGSGFSVTITGLPSVPGAQLPSAAALNNLTPFAGEAADLAGIEPAAGFSPDALNDIVPAAGNTSCWSDFSNSVGVSAVSYSVGGTLADTMSAEGGCGI